MATTKTSAMSTRHLAIRVLISLGLALSVGALFVAGGKVLFVVGVSLVIAGLVVLAPHDQKTD